MNRRLFIEAVTLIIAFLIFGITILSIRETILFSGLKEFLVVLSGVMVLTFLASLFNQRIIEMIAEWHERPPHSKIMHNLWVIFVGILWMAILIELTVGFLEGANRLPSDWQWPVRFIGLGVLMTIIIALLIKRPGTIHNLILDLTKQILKTAKHLTNYLMKIKINCFSLYSILIRSLVFILCLLIAFSFYSVIILNKFTIDNLKGQDILAIMGLTFGIYAVFQVIIRYFSAPNLRIQIPNTLPRILGQDVNEDLNSATTKELRQANKHNRYLRNFAVLQLQVWSFDIPWYFRPLVQKNTIDGSYVRFRYTKICDNVNKIR